MNSDSFIRKIWNKHIMPKRGGGGGGGGGRTRNWKADGDHFEHDDRQHSNNTRRVSFKPGTNKGKNKFKWNDAKLMLDDDVDMGAQGGHGPRKPFRGRGGRTNSPVPHRQHMLKKKFVAGLLPWYQVIIPYGAKHEKDLILRTLLSFISPDVFIPHYYKINGNAAIFYVDDVKVAEKLFNADRKIMMSDGFRLVVIVRNAVPNTYIDDDMKTKMKLTMAKRYNATTRALDLTKFHADPDLSDIFCALFRPMIMNAAIEIMAENIPDIEALNLNENKLHGIEHLKVLSSKFKNLKILYMGDNRIPFLGSLDPLKSLPLVELYLKGNPLVNRFNDHEIYVSEARKKFPKLTRLDGVDLPPAIGFDVAEDAPLPPRQQAFLVDPAGQGLVRDFLTQYFAIFDSESRQPLLEAYHEHASLSMAVNYASVASDPRNSAANKLNIYFPNSRNILRITEREPRRRQLRTGRLQVVSFLSDLPKTTHDLMGFAVDLLVFTPAMIVLTMNGVFKETTTQGTPTRSFHRTFVIVPNSGGGFSVINDMFFITNTAKIQEEKAFTGGITEPTPAPAPVVAGPSMTAGPSMPTPGGESDEAKKIMLTMLGQQTGMNEHWSINCLQETGWDLQRALFIFNQLQADGKIPPQAFVK